MVHRQYRQSRVADTPPVSRSTVATAAAAAAQPKAPSEPDAEDELFDNFELTILCTSQSPAAAKAMAAAEAAQQTIMTTGRLGEAMQSNQLLQRMLMTYSKAQQLYHKAILPHIERHGQLASSPAGLALSMLCELLREQPTKQPGGSITVGELLNLRDKAKSQLSYADSGLQTTVDIAAAISSYATLQSWTGCGLDTNLGIEALVMPDLISGLAARHCQESSCRSAAAVFSPFQALQDDIAALGIPVRFAGPVAAL